MKETNQLRNLMETVDTAFSLRKTISEDWGSSDWYPIIRRIDAAVDKYGMSPETIQDAANEAADFYYEDMGYASPDEAQEAIVDAWKRMSETGKALSKMFAPVAEGKKLDRLARKVIPGLGKHVAGERAKDYGYSSILDKQYSDLHGDETAARDSRIARKAANKYKKIAETSQQNEYSIWMNDGQVGIQNAQGQQLLSMSLSEWEDLVKDFTNIAALYSQYYTFRKM